MIKNNVSPVPITSFPGRKVNLSGLVCKHFLQFSGKGALGHGPGGCCGVTPARDVAQMHILIVNAMVVRVVEGRMRFFGFRATIFHIEFGRDQGVTLYADLQVIL